jgi:hypothetical protein
MAEPSVSVVPMAVPAVVPMLLAGWGSSLVLFVMGSLQRKPVLAGCGILLAGIMVLVTSTLVFIQILPEVEGGFRVTAVEIFTLGLLGFLGGALAILGASRIAAASRPSRHLAQA